MRFLGRLFGRLFAVLFGYLVACFAAGVVIVVGVAGVSITGGSDFGPPGDLIVRSAFISGVVAAFVVVLAAPMAVLALAVAEIFAIRAMLFYVLSAGLVAALGYVSLTEYGIGGPDAAIRNDELVIFVAAGFVAGFVYWALTGRAAGFRRVARR